MINGTRLWIACALIWACQWIAPRAMRPVLVAYAQMLERFPVELDAGRNYGVIIVPWSVGAASRSKALFLQRCAIDAAHAARDAAEVIAP